MFVRITVFQTKQYVYIAARAIKLIDNNVSNELETIVVTDAMQLSPVKGLPGPIPAPMQYSVLESKQKVAEAAARALKTGEVQIAGELLQ